MFDPDFNPLDTLVETIERVQHLENNQAQMVALLRDCQRLLKQNQQYIADLQSQTLVNATMIRTLTQLKDHND